MAIKEPHEVPHAVQSEISELLTRLKGEQVARWILDEVLTAKEREAAWEYIGKEDEHLRRHSTRPGHKMLRRPTERNSLPHAIDIYSHVHHLPKIVAALDLAYLGKRLELVDYNRLRFELGIDELDIGVALRQAVRQAKLVVDEYRTLVIWEQLEFDVPGNSTAWTYFWRLCCAAGSGRTIGCEDFSFDTQPENLRDWKSRLRKLDGFPIGLWKLIRVVKGRHRLCLDANDVRVFPKRAPGAPA